MPSYFMELTMSMREPHKNMWVAKKTGKCINSSFVWHFKYRQEVIKDPMSLIVDFISYNFVFGV